MKNKSKIKIADKVFASLAVFLVLTLTYNFIFASTSYQGNVLGKKKSAENESETGLASNNSNQKSEAEEKSTTTTADQKSESEVDDTESAEDQNKTEKSTNNTFMYNIRTRFKSKDEKSTEDSLETSISGKSANDQFAYDIDEINTKTDDSSDEADTKSEDKKEKEVKKVTKIEKLFLFLPVEIESEVVLNEQGDIVEERKTLLGQILDLFSF